MRKIIVMSSLFLTLSGFVLLYRTEIVWESSVSLMSVLHLWTGMFFIVIFPMYTWDHVRTLKQLSWISFSGVVQWVAGIVLILSGVVLMLYGAESLSLPTKIHTIFTFVLISGLIVHSVFVRNFFLKKGDPVHTEGEKRASS
ncbi:hypothetical protein WDW89_08270 [Deltaproteobacteria bacterium TL4]